MQQLKFILSGKDKFFALADSGLVSVGRFSLSVAVARLCQPAEFAQFVVMVSIQFIFLTILGSSHITPMVNLTPGLPSENRLSVYQWAHRRLMRVEVIVAGLLFVAAWPIIGKGLDAWLYGGFALTTILSIECHYHRACIQASFKTHWALLSDGLSLALTCASVAAAAYLGLSPILAFWWGSALGGFSAALLMMKVWNRGKASATPPEDLRLKAKSDGRAMVHGSVANSICSRIQPTGLSTFGGPLAVADFGVAWTLIGPMRMMSAALNGMFRPRLALLQNNQENSAYSGLLFLVLTALALAGIAGLAAFMVVGEAVAGLIFGPSFADAGRLLPLAVAYGALDAMTTTLMIALQIRHPEGARLASRLRIQAAILSCVLLVPGCLYLGAAGALGSLLAAELLYAVSASVFLSRTGVPLIPFQFPGSLSRALSKTV
jgi:O-antigen/teichoic acid export membrane protein